MFEYPAQWESDVVLTDGGTARIRPCRPDDEPALLALYERLSDESIYLRFFSPVPRPTAVQLERITSIDYVDHMVLVAELGPDIVAVARYDRIAPDVAEIAFAVADEYQHRGIGVALASELVADARLVGITEITALTSPDNPAALAVVRRVARVVDICFDGPELSVRAAIA